MLIILLSFFILLIPNQAHAHLRDGLVGWWKFDEASGNAVDSSGNGNTGTPSGTTIVTNCKRSGCRQFNGTTNYVNVGTPASLNNLTDKSASAWVRLFATPAINYRVVDKTGIIGNNGWEVYIDSARKVYAAVIGYSITNPSFTTTSAIPVNEWTHLAATFDSATKIWKVYINGQVAAGTTQVGAGTQPDDSANSFAIGVLLAGSARYFYGNIDDVHVYNRVLSAQDVQDLYIPGIKLSNGVFRNAHFNQ